MTMRSRAEKMRTEERFMGAHVRPAECRVRGAECRLRSARYAGRCRRYGVGVGRAVHPSWDIAFKRIWANDPVLEGSMAPQAGRQALGDPAADELGQVPN